MRKAFATAVLLLFTLTACGSGTSNYSDVWDDEAIRDSISYCTAKLPSDFPCGGWILELQENNEEFCRQEALYIFIDEAVRQGIPFIIAPNELFADNTFYCDFSVESGRT